MKEKVEIVFKNEFAIEVLDKDFFTAIYKRMLQMSKESNGDK